MIRSDELKFLIKEKGKKHMEVVIHNEDWGKEYEIKNAIVFIPLVEINNLVREISKKLKYREDYIELQELLEDIDSIFDNEGEIELDYKEFEDILFEIEIMRGE